MPNNLISMQRVANENLIPLDTTPAYMKIPEPLAGSLAFQAMAVTDQLEDTNSMMLTKQQLMETGRSPITSDITRIAEARAVDRVGQRFEELLIAGAVTGENWESFLEHFQKGQAEEKSNATIEREFFDKMRISVSEDEPVQTLDTRRAWYDQLEGYYSAREDVEGMLQDQMADLNTDGGQALFDFGMLMIPFLEQYRIGHVMEGLGLGDASLVDYILPGRMLDRIRNKYHTLSPDERRSFAKAMLEMSESQANVMGYQNDFFQYEMATRLLDESYGQTFDWDGLFTSVAGVLDAVYVGRILRGGYLGFKSLARTPIDVMAQINPRRARAALNAAINSPSNEVARAATNGGSVLDIVTNFVYPKPAGVQLRGGPAAVADFQKELHDRIAGIMARTESNGHVFTDAEKAASPERVLTQLRRSRTPYAHMNKAEIMKADSEGVELRILWGQNEDVGFRTFGEAFSRAQATMTKAELKTLKIYRRDFKTGNLKPLSRKESAKLQQLHDNFAATSKEVGAVLTNLDNALAKARLEAPDQVAAITARRDQIVSQFDEHRKMVEATEGEYYAAAIMRHDFNALDKFAFMQGDIGSGGIVGRMFGGEFLKYLQDPAARFSKLISDPALRAGDRSIALESDLLDLLIPSFQGVTDTSKTRIFSLLDRVAEEGLERISYKWLRSTMPDLTNKELQAFVALKNTTDAMYLLHNRRVLQQMEVENFRQLRVIRDDGTESVNAVSPITRETVGRLTVAFDPTTGRAMRLTDDYLDELYARGGSIGKMWTSMDVGRHRLSYGIVDPVKGSKLEALPDRVMSYRPGYVPRIWKGAYFVTSSRGKIFIDGVEATDTGGAKAVTNSRKEAQRIADERNFEEQQKVAAAAEAGEAYTPVYWDYRSAREMNDKDVFRSDLEIMELQGRMFYSRRGEGLEILARDADTHLVQPVESLLRGIRATSQRIGMDTVISSFKNSFLKSFNDILPEPGKLPANAKDIKNIKDVNDPRVAQARNMFQYIRFLEGLDPDLVNKLWRNTILGLAEMFDARGMTKASDWILDRQRDPFSLLRSAGFYAYLGANPIRQYLLQTQQILMLSAWNPKYMATGKMLRDKTVLDAAFTALMWSKTVSKEQGMATYNAILKTGAKMLGTTPEEIDAIVQAFRNSGLPASVDHNMLVNDSVWAPFRDVATSHTKAIYNKTTDLAKLPFQLGKVVGFDRGEFNNLAYTWLTVRNKWINENPGKAWTTKAAQDEIATKARQLSLSMTRTGSFGYQRGWLSLATQFLSIQHKAYLSFAPQFLGGSKAFSNAEKAKIATANLLVWGASGFGIRELAMETFNKFGVEFDDTEMVATQDGFPEPLRQFLLGGLQELALNQVLETVFEEKSSVAISQEFAPASGIVETPAEIFRGIFAGEKTVIEMLFGPVGQMFSGKQKTNNMIGGRIGQGIDTMRLIAGQVDSDAWTSDEIVMMLDAAGKILPAYNNYTKMRYALETGRLVDNRGNPTAHVARSEAYAKGVFGIRSEAEIEWQEMVYNMSDRKRKLNETADTYYDRQMATLERWADRDDDFARARAALELEAYVLQAFASDEWELNVIRDRIVERMGQDITAGKEDLPIRLARAITSQGVPIDQHIRATIQNSQSIPPEQKKALLDSIDYIMSENEARQILTPEGNQ